MNKLVELLSAYQDSLNTSSELEAFADVLTDMLHMANDRGIDFHLALSIAYKVYQKEKI